MFAGGVSEFEHAPARGSPHNKSADKCTGFSGFGLGFKALGFRVRAQGLGV